MCQRHHNQHHALVWWRGSKRYCPRLPPLWGSLATPHLTGVSEPTAVVFDDEVGCLRIRSAVASQDTSIVLRPMLLDDVLAVMQIEAASFTKPYPERLFVRAIKQAAIASNSDGCCALVAWECQEQKLAGYCLFEWKAYDAAQLVSIGTAARFRGRGVARKLLYEVLGLCRAGGAAFAQLSVAADNVAAQGLYKSVGFAAVGRSPRYYDEPEGAIDAIIMKLVIQ